MDYFEATSPEVRYLHPTPSRCKMCTSSVSNVIDHKFSHGVAFYMLNGKNINVMLEFFFNSVVDLHTKRGEMDKRQSAVSFFGPAVTT